MVFCQPSKFKIHNWRDQDTPGCHLSSPHLCPGTSLPFSFTHSPISSRLFSSSLFLLLSLASCEFPNSSKQSRLTTPADSPGLFLTLSLSTDDKGLGLAGQTGCVCVLGDLYGLVHCCRLWCCLQGYAGSAAGPGLLPSLPLLPTLGEAVAGDAWHLDRGSASEFPCGFRLFMWCVWALASSWH